MRRITTTAIGILLGLALSGTAGAQPFPQGQCSGLLCSTIGGSTAPPEPPGPPPNCAGLLCGKIGRPFDKPGAPGVLAETPGPVAAPEPAAQPKAGRHHRKRR